MKRKKSNFISIIMVLVLFCGIGLGLLSYELGFFQAAGAPITFTVRKGENFSHLAGRLQEAGIIRTGRALRWYILAFPAHRKLQRGEFALTKNMSVPELVYALTEGKPIEIKFTVPEGYNMFQVAETLEEKGLISAAEFLKAAKSPDVIATLPTVHKGEAAPKSIEGYIYPDTYTIPKLFTGKEIAEVMVQRFKDFYKTVSGDLANSRSVKEFHFTPHQVITFASIVEKETGAGSERPIIASVFVNRLRKKMRLQTDPTVIYGIWLEQGAWDGNIRKKDLETPTEYNSYTNSGLPPGPIANPGINAIRAVLAPGESDFLYFVSKNDGTHVFSKDYASHEKAVYHHQVAPGAKDGKSWRDLPSEQRVKNK